MCCLFVIDNSTVFFCKCSLLMMLKCLGILLLVESWSRGPRLMTFLCISDDDDDAAVNGGGDDDDDVDG